MMKVDLASQWKKQAFRIALNVISPQRHKGHKELHGKNVCFVFSTMKGMKDMKISQQAFMLFMSFMVKKI